MPDEEFNVTYVSAEVWDELQRELDRPPKVVPALVELFARERRFVMEDDEPELPS